MEEPRRRENRDGNTTGAPEHAVRARRTAPDEHPGHHPAGDEDEAEPHIIRGVD
ncbi:hypothetical protein AB0F13_21855 [Streptomyces sp. NPDC026206]|uniref:hypothetical protein n=1 Tax=Streptomyces sp. NPDC026206 TaxID=3157089 RepID=UPI0033E43FA9